MPAFNQWIETDGCGAMPTSLITETELLTVTTINNLSNLSQIPLGGLMQLVINGQVFTPADGSFSVAGQVIHWLSSIYSVNPGDIVVAIYSYEG